MEINVGIRRGEVTKSQCEGIYYVIWPSNDINICNCWLLSLLTDKAPKDKPKGNKKKKLSF